MGYAKHDNTDVQCQIRDGVRTLPMILGQFREAEIGQMFEYTERWHPADDFHPELQHMICVADGQYRLANVLKTVAYILTGEGEIQKWKIKQHRSYDTSWVR